MSTLSHILGRARDGKHATTLTTKYKNLQESGIREIVHESFVSLIQPSSASTHPTEDMDVSLASVHNLISASTGVSQVPRKST